MTKTSERRKNCDLQIRSPNPTSNTSSWETLGKLTDIWKADTKDAFPTLLEIWKESDALMRWKPLLSVLRAGASIMCHKHGAAALILLWPLPRPFCTQMVTVASTEKCWVGRGADQDSRHEQKESPYRAELSWKEWVGRDEDNWKGWSESDCESETGGSRPRFWRCSSPGSDPRPSRPSAPAS